MKEHLDAHWDHRHNTHILSKTIHGISNTAPPPTLNTALTFNNQIATTPKHIANCFTKQFTNTVKHATRQTDPLTEQHKGYKDITSHNRFNSGSRGKKKVKITTHTFLTN